jgi:hypothetical protein
MLDKIRQFKTVVVKRILGESRLISSHYDLLRVISDLLSWDYIEVA